VFELLKRGWAYMVAALSGKLDERADPKIQIEQAITEAKRQHELLSQQAAAVLGNRHQLEMKLDKQMDEVEKMQASEKAAEDLKHLHDNAMAASEKAKQAVAQNAMLLQQRLAERTKLLNQLDQAKMTERVNDALKSVSALAVPGNTPSLDQVAEKIEARYARAMGASELAETSVESRMLEVQRSALDIEGSQRLEAIRASMGLTKAPAAGAAATPEATPAAATPETSPATEPKPSRARKS
jgi:phage shock protein A